MADTSRFVRPLVFGLCVAVTVLGLINVYGDNKQVVEMAQNRACADRSQCTARMTQMSRNPIGTSFTFQVDVKPQTTVDVDCKRSAYLFGEWSCERSSP